jgi:hypothetical protein
MISLCRRQPAETDPKLPVVALMIDDTMRLGMGRPQSFGLLGALGFIPFVVGLTLMVRAAAITVGA